LLIAISMGQSVSAQNSTIPMAVDVLGSTAQALNMLSMGYGVYYLFEVKNTEAIPWKNLGLGVAINLLNLPYIYSLNQPIITVGFTWGAICLSLMIYAKYLFSGRVHRVDAAMQTEV
jgi:hypothetical protein